MRVRWTSCARSERTFRCGRMRGWWTMVVSSPQPGSAPGSTWRCMLSAVCLVRPQQRRRQPICSMIGPSGTSIDRPYGLSDERRTNGSPQDRPNRVPQGSACRQAPAWSSKRECQRVSQTRTLLSVPLPGLRTSPVSQVGPRQSRPGTRRKSRRVYAGRRPSCTTRSFWIARSVGHSLAPRGPVGARRGISVKASLERDPSVPRAGRS
jgi:hypothetical protein